MGASKTITSPDFVAGTSVPEQRTIAEGFAKATSLDAMEVLYRSGFSRDALLWCAETCGMVTQAECTAVFDAVDAESVAPEPRQIGPERGR